MAKGSLLFTKNLFVSPGWPTSCPNEAKTIDNKSKEFKDFMISELNTKYSIECKTSDA
jgi:hypothetical protein